MTKVCYLSHPIGPDGHVDDLIRRHDNMAIASEWMRYLVRATRWALLSPALTYAHALDGADVHSPRSLTNQVLILERCDLVAQVGGVMSPHMVIERNRALRGGIPVVDLLFLGEYPPSLNDAKARMVIERHAHDAEQARARSVWLPPLEPGDVERLRQAQLVLANDPNSEEAVMLLQRIVHKLMQSAEQED